MNNITSYSFYIFNSVEGATNDGMIRVLTPGFHVIKQTWNSGRIVNSQVISSYDEQEEAKRHLHRAIAADFADDHSVTLDAVMTIAEIATEYDLNASGIWASIERGAIRARQSGATWLILRSDAEKRWGGTKE